VKKVTINVPEKIEDVPPEVSKLADKLCQFVIREDTGVLVVELGQYKLTVFRVDDTQVAQCRIEFWTTCHSNWIQVFRRSRSKRKPA
jgi:hypothetical protein